MPIFALLLVIVNENFFSINIYVPACDLTIKLSFNKIISLKHGIVQHVTVYLVEDTFPENIIGQKWENY